MFFNCIPRLLHDSRNFSGPTYFVAQAYHDTKRVCMTFWLRLGNKFLMISKKAKLNFCKYTTFSLHKVLSTFTEEKII